MQGENKAHFPRQRLKTCCVTNQERNSLSLWRIQHIRSMCQREDRYTCQSQSLPHYSGNEQNSPGSVVFTLSDAAVLNTIPHVVVTHSRIRATS